MVLRVWNLILGITVKFTRGSYLRGQCNDTVAIGINLD